MLGLINFDVSNLNTNDILLKILGGAFLLSILMYALENDSIRKTFENSGDKKINIRKVLAFSLVIGFIGTLFFSLENNAIDAAKEVALVVLSFYFGAESKKLGNQKGRQKDETNNPSDSSAVS